MGKHTIQSLIDEGHTLRAYCHDPRCNRGADLDLQALKARLGPDHGAMHDDLVPLLRCSKCGSKKVGLILSPPTKSSNYVNPYMKLKEGR